MQSSSLKQKNKSKTITKKKTVVKKKIKKLPSIIIYGENWCPFCSNAKKLAKSLSSNVSFISGKSGEYIKNKYKLKTIPRTIPQIIVNKKHIGGYNALSKKYVR